MSRCLYNCRAGSRCAGADCKCEGCRNHLSLEINRYQPFSRRPIEAVYPSEIGFPVIVGKKELEDHLSYPRFSDGDSLEEKKAFFLPVIAQALAKAEAIFEADEKDCKVQYAFYRDIKGDLYMVGVKELKTQKVGFFETIIKVEKIKQKHLNMKRLK